MSVALRGVSRRYPGLTALDGIDPSARPRPAPEAHTAEPVALLRECADDLISERLYEMAKLFEAGGMGGIVHVRKL